MDWLIILASLLLPVVPLFFMPGCPCCPTGCTHCSDSPTEATVTVSGLINSACSSCASFNDTFIFDFGDGPNACIDGFTFSPDPCGQTHRLVLFVDATRIVLNITDLISTETHLWTKAHTSGTACIGNHTMVYDTANSVQVFCQNALSTSASVVLS
jgi:hypothetical protein